MLAPFHFVRKSIIFISRYVLRDPIFIMYYIRAYFSADYSADARFYTQQEVLNHLQAGRSIIRLGDGEMALIHMLTIHFQRADQILKEKLIDLIQTYSESSPYIVCIPQRYIHLSNRALKEKNLFRCWLPFKIEFFRRFPKDVRYGDAHLFYMKGFFETHMMSLLDGAHVIIYTNAHTIASQREGIERHIHSVEWIESPAVDAFDVFESAYNAIRKAVSLKQESNQKILVLLSAGPMSKPLASRLAYEGIQSIDIGHGLTALYNDDMTLNNMLI